MKRNRCCWAEERHIDGMQVLCVRHGERPGSVTELWTMQADEVVVLSVHMRRALRGELMGRVINAVELVSDERLPVVLELFREGFIVAC